MRLDSLDRFGGPSKTPINFNTMNENNRSIATIALSVFLVGVVGLQLSQKQSATVVLCDQAGHCQELSSAEYKNLKRYFYDKLSNNQPISWEELGLVTRMLNFETKTRGGSFANIRGSEDLKSRLIQSLYEN